MSGVVAAIGVFDGVHRGHQLLLRDIVERARALDGHSVCVTFDPDPARVLHPDAAPPALCRTDDRVQRIRALGVDEVFVWPFTQEVADLSPEAFVAQLHARYPLVEVWVGTNFAFGRGRSGSVATLTELGKAQGFHVRAVEPVIDGERPISSSRIRESLLAGDAEEAARLLGR